jgi:L-fuculose-phosphate aldolase
MPIYEERIRQEIVTICQHLYARGFIVGSEGNVSVRVAPDRVWITPTGCHKGFLRLEDLLLIDLQGGVHFGHGRPSSESPMHLALYRARADIQAVVHAHPPMATALTVAGCPLASALLPEAVVVLGDVPTIPYQMPTTLQFAHEVARVMRKVPAALLENHGCVTVGSTLQEAFNTIEIVERVAQIFYLAKTLGHVQALSATAVEALRTLRQA